MIDAKAFIISHCIVVEYQMSFQKTKQSNPGFYCPLFLHGHYDAMAWNDFRITGPLWGEMTGG